MNDRQLIKVWKRLWPITLSVLLGLWAATTVRASSPKVSLYKDSAEAVGLQTPIAPTVAPSIDPSASFQITFLELGYGEKVLTSPYGAAQYTLRLPDGWQLFAESYLDLDLSYEFTEIQLRPSIFGEFKVVVDGEILLTFPIKEPLLEHTRLHVPLPPELLNDPNRRQHTVQLLLDAGHICDVPHQALLTIHPASFFSLAYAQLPLSVDLADYPRPFYQRTFEPDLVQFIMPTEPTPAEMAGALAIAARLGDLTGNRVLISATTDLEWLNQLDSDDPPPEHLVIVGRPETNRLLVQLNEMALLPVSLRARQLDLTSQGPRAVTSGDLFDYTLAVTNTTQRTASGLTLVDSFPRQAQFVGCQPACAFGLDGEDKVRWSLDPLPAGRTARVTLVLSATQVLTDSVMENIVTLQDVELGPINVDTITATISPNPAQAGRRSSVGARSDYILVWNGQAVAEGDGVVQMINSPWNSKRAILLVTGLSDQALYKASQALSFVTEFPGMRGAVALVDHVRHPESASAQRPPTDLTFADLGYDDRTVFGSSANELGFNFFLPVDWRLTDAAYLELSFRHSQLIDLEGSSLMVLLESSLLASIPLNEESAMGRRLQIKLPAGAASAGKSNRITLQVNIKPRNLCETDSQSLWLTVNRESLLHLDHQAITEQNLDLASYPFPFDRDPRLSDVLFALPAASHSAYWEDALRLAAALGAASEAPAMLPAVALGDDGPADMLSDYHIIALGRASDNPWLQRVNPQLPQPFQPGSDEIEQQLDDVVFRLPPGLSLGFVQLIPSPWNKARAFLAVTGTTAEGVREAVAVLNDRPWTLQGNLTLVREDGVKTIDTRGLTRSGMALTMATAVPEMAALARGTATTAPTPPPPRLATPSVVALGRISVGSNRPGWLIPMMGMTGLAVVAIFAIAFRQTRRQSGR